MNPAGAISSRALVAQGKGHDQVHTTEIAGHGVHGFVLLKRDSGPEIKVNQVRD